ncbi:hypothetical protein [Chondromyces crocatus]|uniref:Uncharacterized protein n=1 Tax=Chondromyces crocatus TaxID=52 RepID=A0A0K1EET7_CHOCO|nr:hypothetical protein [Chondromyces crocatus]AKT39202.1 uncharacterized protein CMC5_033510 [Chondromyces crocatus]
MTRRNRGRGTPLDPEDVLSGRVRVTSNELASLIRAVNPTGLKLAPAETTRRYTLKRRLQSLLVRRFGDELRISPYSAHAGVVSLQLELSGSDACHAVVADLDEDARSFVQQALDFQEGLLNAVGPPSTESKLQPKATNLPSGGLPKDAPEDDRAVESSRTGNLRAGWEALAAYDYTHAQELFEAALREGRGDVSAETEAAEALLELLVDHLGADSEALVLGETLGKGAKDSEPVRLLVAQAAARLGERERALAWLGTTRGAQLGEVLATLARVALSGGDLETAIRDIEQLRESAPSHPALTLLVEDLAQARAEETRPVEEEGWALLERGALAEARLKAAEVLARWPGSEGARRLQREVDARIEAKTLARLLVEAEAAERRGDVDLALETLRRTLPGMGREAREAVQKRISLLSATARLLRSHQQAESVLARLREDRTSGLMAYLALDASTRRRVRMKASLVALARLDAMGVEGAGPRARSAVTAVMELEHAAEIVADAPEEALARIRAHPALSVLDEAQRIVAQADRTVARRKSLEAAKQAAMAQEAAERRLDAARQAFCAGDREASLQLLSEDVLASLCEADRVEAASLRTRGATARARRVLGERALWLRSSGALLEAREAIASLLEDASNAEERERLTKAREELGQDIRSALRLRSLGPGSRRVSTRDLDLRLIGGAHGSLATDERKTVFMDVEGCWVFVRLVDVKTGEVSSRAVLRTPSPLRLLGYEVSGDRIVVLGGHGEVLELRVDDGWDVVSYEALRPAEFTARSRQVPRSEMSSLLVPEVVVEQVLLTSAGTQDGSARWVWLMMHTHRSGMRRMSTTIHVIDRDGKQRAREVRGVHPQAGMILLSELTPPLVAISTPSGVTLHAEDGSALDGGTVDAPVLRLGVAAAAMVSGKLDRTGSRLVALVRAPRPVTPEAEDAATPPSGMAEPALGWMEIVDGKAGPFQALSGLGTSAFAVAGAGDPLTGLSFFLIDDARTKRELVAFEAREEGLELRYRSPVPRRSALLRCASGGLAMMVGRTEGLEMITLGPEPPSVDTEDPLGVLRGLGTSLVSATCHRPTGAQADATRALARTIAGEAPDSVARRIAAARRDNDPDRLSELSQALQLLGRAEEGGQLDRMAMESHPRHAGLRVGHARAVSSLRRWSEVVATLSDLDMTGVDDGTAQHRCHLLGMALLHLGRQKEALSVILRGAEYIQGRCDLGWLLALATPVSGEGCDAPEGGWSPQQSAVRELATRVIAADVALAEGNAEQALDCLDHGVVWDAAEVQSLARVAEAHLMLNGGADPFRAALGLAMFASGHRERSSADRRELPLPGRWDGRRLDALLGRAERWLDDSFGGPAHLRPIVNASRHASSPRS